MTIEFCSSLRGAGILLGAFAATTGVFGQQVTMLEVRKESGDDHRTAVEMPYGSEGFASEIGPILISPDGSAELNNVTYRKFPVRGTENSVISAKPVGGDGSAEVEFWSVNDNQFVLKETPEVVALQVRYTPVRKVPVKFDLAFSIGL